MLEWAFSAGQVHTRGLRKQCLCEGVNGAVGACPMGAAGSLVGRDPHVSNDRAVTDVVDGHRLVINLLGGRGHAQRQTRWSSAALKAQRRGETTPRNRRIGTTRAQQARGRGEEGIRSRNRRGEEQNCPDETHRWSHCRWGGPDTKDAFCVWVT